MIRSIALLLSLGVACAVLTVGYGLFMLAAAPPLLGAAPIAQVSTLEFDAAGPATGARDSLSIGEVEAVIAAAGVEDASLTLTTTVDARIDGADRTRMAVAWTAGPLLSNLGVPIVGASFRPIRLADTSTCGSPQRQVVLSRAFARRHFGDAATALGQRILVPSISGFREGVQVELRVAGVVASDFAHAGGGRVVDAWAAFCDWRDVLLPAHQLAQILALRPDGIVLVADLTRAIARLGPLVEEQSGGTRRLIATQGMSAARAERWSLQRWSSRFAASCVGMFFVLVTAYVATRSFSLVEQRPNDWVRSTLGESAAARLWRHLRMSCVHVLVLGCAMGLTLIGWYLAAPGLGLPVRAAIEAAGHSSTWWACLAALVGLWVLPPLAICRGDRLAAQSAPASRRVTGLVAPIAIAVAIGSAVFAACTATLGIMHASVLLDRDLGFDDEAIVVADARRTDATPGAAHLDFRPTAALEAALAATEPDAALALASASPLDFPPQVHAAIIPAARDAAALIPLNFVTREYFRAVGARLPPSCDPEAFARGTTVVANQAFANRYFGGAPPPGAAIRVNDLTWPTDLPTPICGVVADVQYADPRMAPLPVVYAALRSANRIGAIVASGVAPASLATLSGAAKEMLPGVSFAVPVTLAQRMRTQLADETAMARLAVAVLCIVALLAVVTVHFSCLGAAAVELPNLAVRWAVGGSKARIAWSFLRVALKPAPNLVALSMVAVSIGALGKASAMGESVSPVALVVAGVACWLTVLLLGLAMVQPRLSEQALAAQIKLARA